MVCENIKVVLVGQHSVGKSALFRRWCNDTYSDSSDSTLGAAYAEIFLIETVGGQLEYEPTDAVKAPRRRWKVQLWDTAGQERYSALLPLYMRGAAVVMIVHDGSHDSVKAASALLDQQQASECCAVCVVQNKRDLDEHPYNFPLAVDPRVEHAAHVSAKTGEGVQELLLRACAPHVHFVNQTRSINASPAPESPSPSRRSFVCC